MTEHSTEQINLQELCRATFISAEIVIDIVEHGIVEPAGQTPEEWIFSPLMVVTTRKALRLHRDLDINWAGIALAVSLLNELEELRDKNQILERRINRFQES